jgi:hypothetical protein
MELIQREERLNNLETSWHGLDHFEMQIVLTSQNNVIPAQVALF